MQEEDKAQEITGSFAGFASCAEHLASAGLASADEAHAGSLSKHSSINTFPSVKPAVQSESHYPPVARTQLQSRLSLLARGDAARPSARSRLQRPEVLRRAWGNIWFRCSRQIVSATAPNEVTSSSRQLRSSSCGSLSQGGASGRSADAWSHASRPSRLENRGGAHRVREVAAPKWTQVSLLLPAAQGKQSMKSYSLL